MDEREEWDDVIDFPNYMISSWGNIYYAKHETMRKPFMTPRGVPAVTLFRDGRPYTRAVCVLVANAFITKTDPRFDTPISLNGDRVDCRADNLLWRPRSFAVRYHRQFEREMIGAHELPVYNVDTHERFRRLVDAGMKYGLIFNYLFMAIHDKLRIWPTEQLYDWDKQ